MYRSQGLRAYLLTSRPRTVQICGVRTNSNSTPTETRTEAKNSTNKENEKSSNKIPEKKQKTVAQMDEELRMKMEGRAGDGGDAGIELENGKPVAMKRGVRENMFRLI